MEKLRNIVFKVPPNVKRESLKAIEKMMNGKPYRIVTYKQRYGWNEILPITEA